MTQRGSHRAYIRYFATGYFFVLSVLVWVPITSFADVDPQGSVTIVGGDPANDGPLPPDPTPDSVTVLPAEDQVLLGDGASLTLNAGSDLTAGGVGSDPNSNVVLNVQDPGTTLILNGEFSRINIQSDGTINITNGAFVDGSAPCAANCSFSLGTLSGSNLSLNLNTGGILDTTGDALTVGRSNSNGGTPLVDSLAQVSVLGGSVINSGQVFLSAGDQFDPASGLRSNTLVSIDGAGSQWNATDFFQIGSGVNTDATVDVINGGLLSAGTTLSLGEFTGSNGILNLDGAGSQLMAADDVAVGRVGNGTINLTNGATADIGGAGVVPLIDIGTGQGGVGLVDLSGAGTTLNATGDSVFIDVGRDGGFGTLSVSGGAQLTATGGTTAAMFVGDGDGAGSGMVNVFDNGVINIQSINISTSNGTQTGIVDVSGTGSLNATDGISVGLGGTLQGDGTIITPIVSVNDGGTFAVDNHSGIDLVAIDGPSALILPNNILNIGSPANQSFLFAGGSNIGMTDINVGLGAADPGFLSVIENSDLTASNDIIFNNGAGVVNTGGRLMSAGLVRVGENGNGSLLIDAGVAEVVGTGELLNFNVGESGNGLMTVQNGGQAIVDARGGGFEGGIFISWARDADSTGTLNLTGDGSGVSVFSDTLAFIHVGVTNAGGFTSNANFNVNGGASLLISGGTAGSGFMPRPLIGGVGGGLLIGGAGATGNMVVSGQGTDVRVTGAGALLAVGNDLFEARSGNGSLTISDFAIVTIAGNDPDATNADIGEGDGNGNLLVDTNGQLIVAGNLNIALDRGTGTPTGSVTVNGTGTIEAINTVVGTNGTLSGDGTFISETLTVASGGIVDLLDLSRIGSFNLMGTQLTGDDLDLGFSQGQDLMLDGGSSLDVTGVLDLGANNPVMLDLMGGSTLNVDSPAGVAEFNVRAGSVATFTNSNIVVNGGAGSVSQVSGSLFLNGGSTLTVGQLTVDGLFGGSDGTLEGDLSIVGGGILSAGNSPGTITVNGDLNLDGGMILIELAGDQPGQYDMINVSGDLNLNAGEVEFALLDNFSPRSGSTLNVFDVGGTVVQDPGVVFEFAGLGPDFEFSFVPGGNGTVGALNFLAIDVGEIPDLPMNEGSTGEALDDLCPRVEGLPDPSSDEMDLDFLCGALRNSNNTDEQIMGALAAITPDEVTGTIDTLMRHTGVQHGNLSVRLNGLRSGGARVDVAGINIVTDHVEISGVDLQNALESLLGGASGTDDFARWGFFSDFKISDGDTPTSDLQPGFEFETVNFTFGADYRLRDNLFVGAALGYSEVDGDFDVGGGMKMHTTTLTLMGTYFRDAFYVDGLMTYGWADAETRRRVVYDTASSVVDRTAAGDSDASQVVAGIGGGWDFTRGKWVFGPHFGANFTKVTIDKYAERGAGGLDLVLQDQVSRTTTANVGFHVSYTMTPSWGVLVPYFRVDYTHEFQYEGQAPDVRFRNDRFSGDITNPTRPFEIITEDSDPDYFVWSAGVHVQLIHGIAGFIDYQSHAELNKLDLQGITAGVRFERDL